MDTQPRRAKLDPTPTKKFRLPHRARRARRPAIGKSIAIFVVCALGLIGVMVASAAIFTPKISAYQPSDDISVEAPVEMSPSPSPTKTWRPSAPKQQEKIKAVPKKKVQKPSPPPKVIGTRYTCASLNVRAEPGLGAKIVKNVPVRKKIRIMNRISGQDWRMVRFEKHNRWMYAPCLWKHKPPKPKPLPKPEATKKPKPKSPESPKPKRSTAPNVSKGVWDKLAQCESSGNWSETKGTFEGGLQFLNSTWLAYGGGKYAQHAYNATREEQIAVAKKLQAAAGWGQWPACTQKLGLR